MMAAFTKDSNEQMETGKAKAEWFNRHSNNFAIGYEISPVDGVGVGVGVMVAARPRVLKFAVFKNLALRLIHF